MTPNSQISTNNEITAVQNTKSSFNNFQSAFDNYNYQITPIVSSGLSTNESSQHNPQYHSQTKGNQNGSKSSSYPFKSQKT
jgi:hypothetical protein